MNLIRILTLYFLAVRDGCGARRPLDGVSTQPLTAAPHPPTLTPPPRGRVVFGGTNLSDCCSEGRAQSDLQRHRWLTLHRWHLQLRELRIRWGPLGSSWTRLLSACDGHVCGRHEAGSSRLSDCLLSPPPRLQPHADAPERAQRRRAKVQRRVTRAPHPNVWTCFQKRARPEEAPRSGVCLC